MGDEAVQSTNMDATFSKRSAVHFGYWSDPYISQMVSHMGERKAPEIHLGYFTRVTALKSLILKTVEYGQALGRKVQIISLGAGFDTLFWRLRDELNPMDEAVHNYIEVDFPEVTAKKCHLIKKSKLLLSKVVQDDDDEVKLSRTDLHGHRYHLIGADFTDLTTLARKLAECQIDYALPTIFLAECVLIYIEPAKVDRFLTWTTSTFTSALVFLNHEQLNMNDRFGAVIVENMSSRGCGLPGVAACQSPAAQNGRFLARGYHGALCWTMSEVYELLPRDEVNRVEKLELFDEKELMRQLFEHYCVGIAWRNQDKFNFNDFDFW